MDTKQKKVVGGVTVKERVAGLYSGLLAFTRELPQQVTSGKSVQVKSAKRLIQHMVDMITDDEPMLLGMALSENRYEYTYRHPVNVCILSVSLGHRIGLGKKELAELGLVAFLFDIGKSLVPAEVLNKKGVYDENDWCAMKRHTAQGFKAVFGVNDADELLIRAAIVSFEHHLHFDLSGYPKVSHIPKQDFYTRIVAIAEMYDALTASLSYTEGYRSPDHAVRTLLENAGKKLDPTLVRQFVSMMGAYPVGSFVLLDTDELGIVVEPHAVFLKRPRVLVLSDKNGSPVKPFIAALSKRDENGRYLRSVIKTLDPNKYKIDYASFFHRRSPRPGTSS
jgi:HD-GYP domain-containing protein (c-di-GMP phosphodiesterase class II)